MARSTKKPFAGNTTAASDKPWKRIEHRRERSVVRRMLLDGYGDEDLPHTKEFGNPWSAPKDGKHRIRDIDFLRA